MTSISNTSQPSHQMSNYPDVTASPRTYEPVNKVNPPLQSSSSPCTTHSPPVAGRATSLASPNITPPSSPVSNKASPSVPSTTSKVISYYSSFLAPSTTANTNTKQPDKSKVMYPGVSSLYDKWH